MKNILLLVSLISANPVLCQSIDNDTTTIFDDFNEFMLDHVAFGLVDYSAIKQNPRRLNNLIKDIAEYNLKGVSQDHRTAFFINTYNILVIKQIVDNYPVDSPMDINGFFKIKTWTVAGETLTLDQIEFSKLFAETKDPRIHFALGCGARSCPFLYDNGFYPNKLQEQLELRAQLIIDRPNYVYVDDDKKTVLLNKIFDWYTDQFVAKAGSLIEYVNLYRYYKVPKDYRVIFHEYDWSLNDR
ncbi:DUF547 domain-containing protein [Ekhidna sp.]|uniref:DUF547 domain-containing protein n=1 Tax=Ekhidna sp. TaxID=2608089 RepID=UPI003CCB76BB